jgi:hypothetical protein
MAHTGGHIHSKEEQLFHFCEERYVLSSHFSCKELRLWSCRNCGYFCSLPLGKKVIHQHITTYVVRWQLKVTHSKSMKLAMVL